MSIHEEKALREAVEFIREKGFRRALWLAHLQKRAATDRTTEAHWERVIEAMLEIEEDTYVGERER